MEKNIAFFSLYENVFETYQEIHGRDQAVSFLESLFANALGKAYDLEGFEKGSPNDFARVVKSRDNGVGLKVELPVVSDTKIVYQFHDDPFPGLKGKIDKHDLDMSYLKFKISYLLGNNWKISTTKHIWDGAPYSEHIIEKI